MSNRSEHKHKAKCDKVKGDRKDVSESWKAGKLSCGGAARDRDCDSIGGVIS
jgi:hypothetical protein